MEREFERLYLKHIKDKQLDEYSHRTTLMVCLAAATYKVLDVEVGNTELIREVIRTNLGGWAPGRVGGCGVGALFPVICNL